MHTLLIFVITQPYKVAPYQVKTRHGLLINAVIYLISLWFLLVSKRVNALECYRMINQIKTSHNYE